MTALDRRRFLSRAAAGGAAIYLLGRPPGTTAAALAATRLPRGGGFAQAAPDAITLWTRLDGFDRAMALGWEISPDLDLVVCLGDYIYERSFADTASRNPPVRTDDSASDGEAQTLEDYRRKYALYQTDPNLLAVRLAHPLLAIWDDHEVNGPARAIEFVGRLRPPPDRRRRRRRGGPRREPAHRVLGPGLQGLRNRRRAPRPAGRRVPGGPRHPPTEVPAPVQEVVGQLGGTADGTLAQVATSLRGPRR